MGQTLFNGDLQAVVVGSLIGLDVVDVGIERRCGREAVLRVQLAAIVDRAAGVRISASLSQVSAACARCAGGGDVELRRVEVLVDRLPAIQRADIVRAKGKTAGDLLLDAEVELIGEGPLEMRVDGGDLVEGKEAGGSGSRHERECREGVHSARKLRWIVRVRVGHRCDLAEGGANGIGSEVRGQFPQVAGDAAEEDAGRAVDDRLAVAIGIPRETDARRDVIVWSERAALWHTRVPREEHADGSQLVAGFAGNIDGGERVGLHAGNEVGLPVLRVGGRLLPIVADTQIQSQAMQNVPVVLCKAA